ncbi:MAG: hypothetical protein UHN47_07095 [Lachnospiraceae bacterium]|nr:hypothetical protein [Lachnospiraceae bacterium]
MINENRLNMLHEVMIMELAKAIDSRHPDKPVNRYDDKEVFSRLTDLYDEAKEVQFGKETGKSYKFMPKQYKEMVMKLIAPDSCFTYRTTGKDSDSSVTVEAFLYLNYSDDKPIATGKATVSYSSAPTEYNDDEWGRKMYCESAAKGLAESKALQKYGIGSWYSYSYEPEENPEEAIKTMKQKDELNPQVAYDAATTDIENQTEEKFDDAEPNSEPEKADVTKDNEIPDTNMVSEPEEDSISTTVAEQSTKNEEMPIVSEQTDVSLKNTIPLEDAKKLPAECGRAKDKGLTLGQTADTYPGNILWMYTKGDVSEDGKKALLVIARNYPAIKASFIENGIDL